MNIKLASPLYILREECSRDLFGVLRALKNAGFDGVELLGFFGQDPKKVGAFLKEIGLTCTGNHVPFEELLADPEETVQKNLQAGCSYLTIAAPVDGFSAERYAQLEVLAQFVRSKGLTPLYHNHREELLLQEDGTRPLDTIMAKAPTLQLEPDLGWMAIGGASPAEYLQRYQQNSPVLHFKDYTPAEKEPGYLFRPTGYGVMNYPSLMSLALACNPEWIVLDHDCAYENDSVEELKLSLDYLRRLLRYYPE